MSTQTPDPATRGPRAADGPPIGALVPMIHVADPERSIRFYRLLGFEVGHFVPPAGPMHWAWLYAPKAADWKRGPNLMVTRSRTHRRADAGRPLLPLCRRSRPGAGDAARGRGGGR